MNRVAVNRLRMYAGLGSIHGGGGGTAGGAGGSQGGHGGGIHPPEFQPGDGYPGGGHHVGGNQPGIRHLVAQTTLDCNWSFVGHYTGAGWSSLQGIVNGGELAALSARASCVLNRTIPPGRMLFFGAPFNFEIVGDVVQVSVCR
jgi:hypothetical protein